MRRIARPLPKIVAVRYLHERPFGRYCPHMAAHLPRSAGQTVSYQVNSLLKEQRIGREELSDKTGISDRTLRRKLNSGEGYLLADVERIAAALDVSIGTLLTQDEETSSPDTWGASRLGAAS